MNKLLFGAVMKNMKTLNRLIKDNASIEKAYGGLPDYSFMLVYSKEQKGGKNIFQKVRYHVWHAYLSVNRWLTDRNIVKPKYTPKK